MSRVLKLIIILLVVPLAAFFVARYCINDLEGSWQELLIEELGEEEAMLWPSAQLLCEVSPEFRTDFPEECQLFDNMHLLQTGAIIAVVLGLGMLLLIRLAGKIVQNKRDLLWRVFGPGLRLTLAAMVVLIALNGALAVAAVWYGESALIGRVHIKLLAGFGLATVLGVFAMAKSTFRLIKPGSTSALGMVVPRSEHPALWRFVDDIAQKLSTQPPDNILVGLEPNFYVTEFDVHHPEGTLTGRTLFLSLPLARVLTRDELAAVVGHELGHFRGEDTAFSQRFYPIFRGAQEAMEGLERHAEGWSSITLLPAMVTLGYFLDSFVTAESKISREREFVADQAGVEAAGSASMATALVKVHAYGPLWEPLFEQVQARLQEGSPMCNASQRFAELAQEKAVPESLQGLDEQRMPHPVDSHPPLRQRLDALGYSLSQVSEAALEVTPSNSAADLFTSPETVEVALTDQLNGLVRSSAIQAEAA